MRSGKVTKDRTHIFYFHHNLAPAILDIIRYLDKKRFRFTICNFWGNDYRKEDFLECGAQVVCLKARRVRDPLAWFKLIRLLIKCQPDIIHTILPELSVPVRLISPFLTKPLIVHTFQNPLSSEPVHLRLANLYTMSICAFITGVSNGVAREIIQQRPELSNKTMVIPNGVNPEEFSPSLDFKGISFRDELGLDRDNKLLACVGRLAYQKGQDILIKSMTFLKAKSIQAKLILIGPDYWNGYLQSLVSSLRLEKEVVFLGWRKDIARILADIDIYVVPSRWEGLSFALCEAMLCAKPCVSTMIPWLSELLVNKETAITVPVGNEKKLAEAIIWMMDHPQEARIMAANARNLVKEKYTAKKMAESYEKLYVRLINNRG